MTASDFTKMLNGKLKPMTAFATGKLKVEGDLGKAAEFGNLLK